MRWPWATADERPGREDLRAQFNQSIETFRFLLGLERQAWGLFAAADVLLIVYGLSLGIAGPVLFGLFVLLALLLGSVSIYRHLVPVAFAAYNCERELGFSPGAGLVETYGRVRSPGLVDGFELVRQLVPEERPAAIRPLMSVRRSIGIRSILVIAGLMVAQVALSLVLLLGFQYPLFGSHAASSSPPPSTSGTTTPTPTPSAPTGVLPSTPATP